MAKNSQSRKWDLTINNPVSHGMTHEKIKEELMKFVPDYFCISDEIGEQGTYHTHIFIYSTSPMRWETMKKRFPAAHIEKAEGSAERNHDYVAKIGDFADKAWTSVPGTFEEYGDLPTKAAEKAPDMASLINDIEAGMSTYEIIKKNPKFAFRSHEIDALRVRLNNEDYKYKNRLVEVIYLWGDPGTGKTRSIYEQHGAANVYRITDYPRNGLRFDGYNRGQDVLVFEEFYSDKVPINQMLNLLDIYPLELPARYDNKVACYTKVYIVSNIPLEQQYKFEQKEMPATWQAFLRRIHKVEHLTKKEESWTQQTLVFDSEL